MEIDRLGGAELVAQIHALYPGEFEDGKIYEALAEEWYVGRSKEEILQRAIYFLVPEEDQETMAEVARDREDEDAPEWVAVYTKDGEFIRFKRVLNGVIEDDDIT